MRILHVSDVYLPRLGGIELHLRDLIAQQQAAGHDARIVTVTPADAESPADPAWVERLAHERPGLRQAVADLERRLRSQPVDVVHVHASVLSPFATLAAQRCASLGLACLVTVHSMWTGLGPLPDLANGLLGLRGWPICWSAVSEAAAEPMRQMLGPGVEVRLLPNAVDPDRWRTAGPTWAETSPTGEPPTIVSVMRLTRVKRTLPLARMLRRVHEQRAGLPLRAVVIGDGPQAAPLERYLRRHGMSDWVELPGRLDRSEIHEHLLRAAVYVAPAERESFGIAALEARTVGIPVVASSRSGVGEFITSGVEGLLGANDDEMAADLVRLLVDDGLRSSIARHNRRVPPMHDWATAVAGAERLYGEALRTARVDARAQPRVVEAGSLR